jgi:ribosomal protein S18 acetylase RimI-like enzyme
MGPTPEGHQIGSHGDVTFIVRGTDSIDLLEPLWLSLFDHHTDIGNAGLRTVSRSHSWPRRRQLYKKLFREEAGTFVLLAERQGQAVGYALCHLNEGCDDTWDTGEWIGEVETLAILPDVRGDGLGTALLDAAEQELARRGAHDIVIAVMEGNDRALDFYRRRGMSPTMTFLMRLAPDVM